MKSPTKRNAELKKKTNISRLASVLLGLFDFKQPVIKEIDFLDIVVEDHPLFLVSWRFGKAYYLRIANSRKRYKSEVGALIVRLSSELETIEVVVRNVWRKKTFKLELTKKRFEKEQAATLIANTPYIKLEQVPQFDIKIGNVNVKPAIRRPSTILAEIQVTIPKITVNNEYLKYIPT